MDTYCVLGGLDRPIPWTFGIDSPLGAQSVERTGAVDEVCVCLKPRNYAQRHARWQRHIARNIKHCATASDARLRQLVYGIKVSLLMLWQRAPPDRHLKALQSFRRYDPLAIAHRVADVRRAGVVPTTRHLIETRFLEFVIGKQVFRMNHLLRVELRPAVAVRLGR